MADAHSPNVESLLAHARWARSLARELIGDPHLADDLAQDALTAALVHPPSDAARSQGWLARILRNRSVSRRRHDDARDRAEPHAARPEAQPSTLELVEQAEAQRRLVECVLQLDEPYRRTVLLRWFGDLPPREIARVENVPLATVTSRLTRAHAKLRERLANSYGGDERSWIRALTPLALADLRPTPPFTGPSASPAAPNAATLAGAKGSLALAFVAALTVGLGFFAWRASSSREADSAASASTDGATPTSWNESAGAPATRRDLVEPSVTLRMDDVQPADGGSRLHGRVLTPQGTPAAGAIVGTGSLEHFQAAAKPAHFLTTTCDELGRFAFADLGADLASDLGAAHDARWIELTATHPDAAPSATASFYLENGKLTDPVVLQLRAGGRVHGVVLRPDGKPAAEREVRLTSDFGAPPRSVRCDDYGLFEFASVAVGRWTILTFPGEDEVAELRLGEPNSVSAFEHLAQRTFQVQDGADVSIELGRPPLQPVTVDGRVTRAGQPHSALLQFVGAGERALELQRIARTDADGNYRVALSEPGVYLLKITAFDAPGTHYVERVVQVPAHAEWRHDIELPGGAIRGRVVDAEGRPVAGVSVRLKREDGARTLLTAFSDARPTREDGTFAFERLDDGRWSLSASAESTAEQGEIAGPIAASVSAALEVRDGRSVDGVEIRLAKGALLRGISLDDRGVPLGLASIVVHAADGSLVTPFAWVASDVDGAFLGPALAPGEYWVHARRDARCSAPQRVVVDGSDVAPLRLSLDAGGSIRVGFESPERALEATVSVRDDADREFANVVARATRSLDVLTSFAPGAREIGPLPPGRYVVQVDSPGADSVRRVVAVEAGEATLVEIR